MNHVYWQTRAVFTNVIDNIMNHVYWQTMNHAYWQTMRYLPMPLIIL